MESEAEAMNEEKNIDQIAEGVARGIEIERSRRFYNEALASSIQDGPSLKFLIIFWTVICAALFLLAGCDAGKSTAPPKERWYYDQDLRRTVFLECLQRAPAGPTSTRYNDWSEVVEECGMQAADISLVDRDHRHKSGEVSK